MVAWSVERKQLRLFFCLLNSSLMVLQMAAVLCALARPAYAYVDPGSGFLAVQMVSTTFAGFIFLIRRRIRSFFGTRNSAKKNQSDQKHSPLSAHDCPDLPES